MDVLFVHQFRCPYCGEPIELQVDASSGEQGYIEDCSVCCRPIELRLYRDGGDWGLRCGETMSEYLPIDCDQHSVLELLAMRRTPVVARAEREDGEGLIEIEGHAQDVCTRDGAEYLVLADRHGGPLSIRLDRLQRLASPAGRILWRQKPAIQR